MAASTARKKPTARSAGGTQRSTAADPRKGRSDTRKAVATKRPANVKSSTAPEVEGPWVDIGGVTYALNENLTSGLLSLIFVAVDSAEGIQAQREAATLLSDVFAPGEFLRMAREFLTNGAVPMEDVVEAVALAVAEESDFPTE